MKISEAIHLLQEEQRSVGDLPLLVRTTSSLIEDITEFRVVADYRNAAVCSECGHAKPGPILTICVE